MEQRSVDRMFKKMRLVIFILGVILAVYLALKASIYLLPMIIGFALSTLMDPFVRLAVKKLKLPRKFASFLSIIILLSTVGFLIFLIISKLSSEISSIYHVLPIYFSDTYNNLNNLANKSDSILSAIPTELRSSIQSIIVSLIQTVKEWILSVLKSLVTTAISIPEAFIFTIVTILSTYFFSSDRETIAQNVTNHLPDSWMNKLKIVKDNIFSALIAYFRAQMIIMSITFTELFIGLNIIGIKYSLLISISIAIIDILPVLGTGGVLIPWATYSFLVGNTKLGISLLILYVIVLLIRQLIEPKIVGQQIGLHPLITLTAMYTGLKLFGVIGMIFGPITILVLKNIFSGALRAGFIKDLLNRIKPPTDNI